MIITQDPSPNFNERKKKIKYLILHYTGRENPQESLAFLKGKYPKYKVSAHYFIDYDGSIIQIVDEKNRAWHAGVSKWHDDADINSSSIGIEIQNPGHEFGYQEFPDKQIDSVIDLCQDIIKRNNIKPYDIIAHSDIAPDRKQDPGELFPWKKLSANNIGIWPDVNDDDKIKAKKILDSEENIKLLFAQYGYNPNHDIKTLITAFQRHFEPEAFLNPENIGKANINTLNLITSLIHNKVIMS